MFYVQSLFGALALLTSCVGLLPQSYKAFKTRSTHDVSMLMLMNYLLCSVAWIIYGSCTSAGFVIASNVLGLASVLLLIFQKNYYDQRVLSHVNR